jgi:hypothetical protein
MASTQEFYRVGGRLPRYTTKLNPFASGMYLTKQVIPEGYAKVMVNYDIDDTGSHIRPKAGRQKIQALDFGESTPGPINVSDYVYAYNSDLLEVESIKDIIMSYGYLTNKDKLVGANTAGGDYDKPFYIAGMKTTTDTNLYELDDETGEYKIIEAGSITEKLESSFWAAYYDQLKEQFEVVSNTDIGTVAARTITGAYAFNKPVVRQMGRPVGAVLNNELITFSGGLVEFNKYIKNSERNEVSSLQPTQLCRLLLKKKPNDAGYEIVRKLVDIRELNPLEAGSYGFNQLSETPYEFENVESNGLEPLGIVMYRQDDLNTPVFSPTLGKPVTLTCYYAYPINETESELQIKIETLDNLKKDAKWVVVKDFPKEPAEGDPERPEEEIIKVGARVNYEYTPVEINTIVRITARIGYDDATMVVLGEKNVICGENRYDSIELKKFQLNKCKGMINWHGSLGVYGVPSAADTIFFSDVNNPGYFPFPNNAMSFDNEILAVHNYLDHLLVITVDSIWLVTPNTTIATSIQKRIMFNIHIPEIDAINAIILKDQIFFKSDTQFYVLKPNKYTSDATDLKNYVNSTAIANFTADFKDTTVDLLNQVYRNIWQKYTAEKHTQVRFVDFQVLDTNSALRNEEVHYIYTIKPILTIPELITDNLNLHIVYNTLSRSWRLYFVAIGDDNVGYNPILYKNKQSGDYCEFFAHTNRLVISKQTKDIVTDNLEDGAWLLSNNYDSYQYLDTGNVSIDDVNTRRFREVQFNLANLENKALDFYVDFKIEGQEKVSATNYVVEHVTDPNDPQYGKIFVTPVEGSNMTLPGATALADDINSTEYFSVDLSKFPTLDVATVRFNLQGRGHRGSIQLLSTSLSKYELSDMCWAYRIMSAR